MASVNKVIVIGHVGGDPDLTEFTGGGSIVRFSLATTKKWKTKDGEKKEKTAWHNIVVHNKALQAVVMSYVKKGSKIFVEGTLDYRHGMTRIPAQSDTRRILPSSHSVATFCCWVKMTVVIATRHLMIHTKKKGITSMGVPLQKLVWALREASRRDLNGKRVNEKVVVREGEIINIAANGMEFHLGEVPGQQSYWLAQDSNGAVIASRPCYMA